MACLLVETIQLGEIEGHHHGTCHRGWFNWFSQGYTPAGVELWNGVRGLDLLASLPEVDGTRLGVTGISGGGAVSWWVAAADERVKVVAPVCGTATFASHVRERTVDGHCDCMFPVNLHRWELADVARLIAPRPMLIGSANRDGIFHIRSIRESFAGVKKVYDHLGAGEKALLIETPGGHSYHANSRRGIFSWFLRHLEQKEVSPEAVGDIDDSPAAQEDAATLRVYQNGVPTAERVTTIHEDFFTLPELPSIVSADQLADVRDKTSHCPCRDVVRTFPKCAKCFRRRGRIRDRPRRRGRGRQVCLHVGRRLAAARFLDSAGIRFRCAGRRRAALAP